MHWKTLKIATVVALLASPSAIAAIPAGGAVEGAVATAETVPYTQLAQHRGDRDDRFQHRRPREVRDGHHHRGRDRFHPGRGRHPHFRHHPRRPRYFRWHRHGHFRGRPIRRLFRHWLRNHY